MAEGTEACAQAGGRDSKAWESSSKLGRTRGGSRQENLRSTRLRQRKTHDSRLGENSSPAPAAGHSFLPHAANESLAHTSLDDAKPHHGANRVSPLLAIPILLLLPYSSVQVCLHHAWTSQS